MIAAIVAGGAGLRLRPLTGDLPKALLPFGGRTLIEIQLDLCRRHGFTDVHLLLGHGADQIRDRIGDGSALGVHCHYHVESQPLGTAGALLPLLARFPDADILTLYGDIYLEMDLTRLLASHRQNQADATLVVHPNDHPADSDLVETDGERVVAFWPRNRPQGWYPNCANAAVFVLNGAIRNYFPGTPADLGSSVLPRAVAAGARVFAYSTPEYIKDVGSPERFDRVTRDSNRGVPAMASLNRPRAAVFFDRDGTLVRPVPYLSRCEDLDLFEDAAAAVARVNRAGLLAVLVTNQPQLARGELTPAGLREIHNKLETLLGRGGAWLDAIYFCPHHPDSGFPGEVAALKTRCDCRKPGTALFEQAARRLNIDLAASFVVGDSPRDWEAARRIGARPIALCESNGLAVHHAAHLSAAVDWLLSQNTQLAGTR